jgi:putative heme-binding domain-containing protein
MSRLRFRSVCAPLAILASMLLSSSGVGAPPQDPPRANPRTQTPLQRSPAQTRTSASVTTNKQSSAQLGQKTATDQLQPMETADPKARAEFIKLIGANWIWSPAYEKDAVPVGDCYFRKTITIANAVDLAQVHIACDNQYQLFVNGKQVGTGADWRKMDIHDITKLIRPGINVIAVKGSNTDAGAAGLVARVIIKEKGGTFESYSTDKSWRTTVKEFANWNQPEFRDREWLEAKVYGPLGAVLPWGDEVVIANEGSRFLIDPEFVVERLVTDEQAGSLIAMTFNSQGDILASREGGPLELIRDRNHDRKFDDVQVYCDKVKNVQGILSLGTTVFASGDGPEGGALYRMTDSDADGKADTCQAIVKFRGLIGEHGPHGVQLGPEGLIYVLCGNFARGDIQSDPRSPYRTPYEGDLVQPRYEDPQGYAAGVPAPGGTILRTDSEGSFVEVVAGGFRNPYDFAFNPDGELFTYDADMEWDIGLPWYRPTRVNHVPAGAELGWRSGWAKWPEYYIDSLPATLDVGPGSPTGVEFYNHVAFPKRYQNAMFVGDWSLGLIHAIKFERDGATYKAKLTTILKGRPLNVTDLAVGPDGGLYFCTGGRGTDGGIYRITWKGQVPAEVADLGQGIQQALRQPQFQSDFARRRIALVQKKLGDQWAPELRRVLADKQTKPAERLRAIDLMTYFGPAPTADLLVELSRDSDSAMRAKAARLMGSQQIAEFGEPLTKLLNDSDPWVRRVACESIAHRGTETPADALVALLDDSDRFVAFAARRTLEGMPAERWQRQILSAKSDQTFLQGAVGLLVADPSADVARQVLARCETMLRDKSLAMKATGEQSPTETAPTEYRDVLRLTQLALIRGQIAPQDVPGITRQIVRAYPTTDSYANRELVKLLAYLQPPEAAHAMAQQLASDIDNLEKLQIAAYAPRVKTGWQTDDKLAMLRYYESARGLEGGHSVGGYIEGFARDFFTNLSLLERRQVLAAGENFPTSALSVLAKLPANPGADVLADIRALDERIAKREGEPMARLRVGTVAALGASGEPKSLAYLRTVYQTQPDRRAPIAVSLAQYPDGEDWDVLVDSLRSVDGMAAQEVLTALARVKRRPSTADPYRNVILQGLRLGTSGGELAVELMKRWTGQALDGNQTSLADQLAVWQAWYTNKFPDALPAELPHDSNTNKWSYAELLTFLDSPEGKSGNPIHGAKVFHDAQCGKCHRINGDGGSIGPDLSSVSQRFQRKEVLESIVYPSQVVSDQYASRTVVANGRTYNGIAAKDAQGNVTIAQSDGQKVQLAAADIESMSASKQSVMPEGLLNPLTLDQVADLFAYLMAAPSDIARRIPAATR